MTSDLPISRAFPARCIRVAHASGSLVLRPTLVTDALEIERAVAASLPALQRFMPWAHSARALPAEVDRLRRAEADYFAGRELVMGLFRGDTLLAMAGLHPRVPLNPNGLEVGYWAPTPHAGQGWTTLVVQLLAVYAFDRLGCDRLQVMCDEANVASRRVIEKCGFVLEGVMRGMTAQPAPELLGRGLCHTGRHPMFALAPDSFARLPWVEERREQMTYVDLLGRDGG